MHTVRAISGRLGFGASDYRIFRAGAILATFGALAKLSGIARDIVIASKFGVGDALDAYVVAFTIPTLVFSVFISTFGASLIPTYIELRKDNSRAVIRLVASIFMLVCLASAAAVVIVSVTSHPFVRLVGAGFSPAKSELTLRLLQVLLPIIFLQGIANFWGSLLNADGRFALAASTPIITSTISTIAVWRFGAELGIEVLAASTLLGLAIEAIVIAAAARRHFDSLMPRWHGYDRDSRAVLVQYFPIMAGGFVTSIIALVDQTVAARLGPGSIAALNYGNKLVTVVLTLIAVAIGTAVLPYFSRFVAVRDWRGARACLHRWIAIMFLSSLIVTGIFLIFADEITALIFQRGAFTGGETAIVASITRCYSLQFPFFFCNILCVRMMIALRLNRALLRIAILDLLINVSLDILLARVVGPAGIAIACSVVYAFSFACVWVIVERHFAHEIRRTEIAAAGNPRNR
jgi:putative peptidoglycan lipid II flippase